MGETLNMDRLLMGVRYEYSKVPKSLMYFTLVVIGFHILECLELSRYNGGRHSFWALEDLQILYASYYGSYIKFGMLLTLFISRDNQDSSNYIRYLSAPISISEKYLAKLLSSFLIYTVVFHIGYYLLHLVLWFILSSWGTYLVMPPLFSFDNMGLIVVLGIINSLSIYFCTLLPKFSKLIAVIILLFVWLTSKKYLPVILSFLSSDNPYLQPNYILLGIGLLAIPLGYYALKNQQYSIPNQSKWI